MISTTTGAAVQVLSQTVGSVGDSVISSRDVQIQAAIERVLFPLKEKKEIPVAANMGKKSKNKNEKSSSGLFEIQPKEALFQPELSSTLLEFVIQKEAESFQVAQPSDEEVKESQQKVEKAVAGNSYWSQLEVGAKELSASVRRKLVSKKFIKIKADSMTTLVTDQEASTYYEKNRLKFGQLPFTNFKENIKGFLAQQQLEERLKSWFEIIKRKYKVRNYLVEGRPID